MRIYQVQNKCFFTDFYGNMKLSTVATSSEKNNINYAR